MKRDPSDTTSMGGHGIYKSLRRKTVVEDLLYTGLIEADNDLITDIEHRHAQSPLGKLSHLIKGFPVLCDIVINELYLFFRKKLFRFFAEGSCRGGIQHDL
jgi:hypothetical protein